MAEEKFLTTEEVSERYRGQISVGTLRNWRAQRVGPPYIKIGKSVLYPVPGLEDWDKKNLVICRASHKLIETFTIYRPQTHTPAPSGITRNHH